MVLPQGGSTFVSGGGVLPPTGWLDKPLPNTRHENTGTKKAFNFCSSCLDGCFGPLQQQNVCAVVNVSEEVIISGIPISSPVSS